MSVSFNYTDGTLVLILNNVDKTINEDHHNFSKIMKCLVDGDSAETILDLTNEPEATEEACEEMEPVLTDDQLGELVISNGSVTYNGTEVDEHLAQQIAELQSAGLPIDGMANYIRRIYEGFSSRVRKELLSFSHRNGLTIDSNGFIIAYKAVTRDYMDKHTGKINNSPGRVISMKRNLVDDDFNMGCSKGLHAGALSYARGFGHGDDRMILVKIDPADVVSVPSCSDCQKLRTCRYEVIGDYEGELKQKVYSAEYDSAKMYDDDEDFFGEDDDDDDDDDIGWDDFDDLDDLDDDEEDDFFADGEVSSEPVNRLHENPPF